MKSRTQDTAFNVLPGDGIRKQFVPVTELLASTSGFELATLGLEGWHTTGQATKAANYGK